MNNVIPALKRRAKLITTLRVETADQSFLKPIGQRKAKGSWLRDSNVKVRMATFSSLLNALAPADQLRPLRVRGPVGVAVAISLIVKVKDTT